MEKFNWIVTPVRQRLSFLSFFMHSLLFKRQEGSKQHRADDDMYWVTTSFHKGQKNIFSPQREEGIGRF